MLRELDLKSVYNSEDNNLLEEFYIPALSHSCLYQRSVGYFSAATISYAAQAYSLFVHSGGKIELILGAFVREDEYEAVVGGYNTERVSESIGGELNSIFEEPSSELFSCRLRALAWLVANEKLTIKVALRKKGLFHEKVGILSDQRGDRLVFTGSANETDKALMPGYNYESINVFPTWRSELKDHWLPHVTKFDNLWANKVRNTPVIDLPEASKLKLVRISKNSNDKPNIEIEREIWNQFIGSNRAKRSINEPHIPSSIGNQAFSVRAHQREALESWQKQGYKGILALATGAGKTITSIYAAVKLANAVKRIAVVVSVPYQDLGDQWCEVLSQFGFNPIQCYRTSKVWRESFANSLQLFESGAQNTLAIVVVNRTLSSPTFQSFLDRIPRDKLLWIGDECHHHASKSISSAIPQDSAWIMGLSATPEHYLDEARNQRLRSIYGEVVYTYSLAKAVNDGILTPYKYFVIPVELTEDEADQYRLLSEQIARLFAAQSNSLGSVAGIESETLQAKLRARSRLIASAKNKIDALAHLIEGLGAPVKHSLFYCGDGVYNDEGVEDEDLFGKRQIEIVSEKLREAGWKNSRFTARESSSVRVQILSNFKAGEIDSLVAIKCLDEGIDIPACDTAFILASSKDPRQFIQRRGRILRKAPNKELATIYDFLVVLPKFEGVDPISKRLVKGELERVSEFSRLSVNSAEIYDNLRPLLQRFNLEHLI